MKRMLSWWKRPFRFAIVIVCGSALIGCNGSESPLIKPTSTESPRSILPVSTVTPVLPTATIASLVTKTNQEVELPFETIERAEFGWTGVLYQGKRPKLDVIARAEDVSALDGTISPDAQAQVQAVDFNEYLVLAAFQGWRPSLPTPSGVQVQRITWNENTHTITIDVHLYEPVEGTVSKDVVISAYHLVKLEKTEKMRGEIAFVLEVDGTAVSEQIVALP
jgi:hypothetical protein